MQVKDCHTVIEPYAQNADIESCCQRTQMAKLIVL